MFVVSLRLVTIRDVLWERLNPLSRDFMSKYLPIAERLREERERMGLSQADFAAIAGATRKTQYNYERGERMPDAAYLADIAAAGADVQYILTGIRSGTVAEKPLSQREKVLLDNYENTSEEGKRIIEATAGAAAQPKRRKASGE